MNLGNWDWFGVWDLVIGHSNRGFSHKATILFEEDMIANYGFKDASGDWYVTIDTDRCNGCGKCLEVCPAKILAVGPDQIDPFRQEPVAFVKPEEYNKIKYSCAPCRPSYGKEPTPCRGICEPKAISHSEGWKLQFGSRWPDFFHSSWFIVRPLNYDPRRRT